MKEKVLKRLWKEKETRVRMKKEEVSKDSGKGFID